MLVLSRKPGQQILIGDCIAITVVRISKNTVRIGIDCPEDIDIIRGELEISLDEEAERDEARAAIEATEKPHGCLANRTEC